MNDQEHRHRKQVEYADPDKKCACYDHLFYVESQQHPEQNQVGDEEMVDDGNKLDPRQPGHQRAVERLCDEQAEKRSGKEPRQVFDTTGDAHLIAQRTQHVVAGKQCKRNKRRTTALPNVLALSQAPRAVPSS